LPVLAPVHAQGSDGGAQQNRLCTSPLKLPLDSARHATRGRGYNQCRTPDEWWHSLAATPLVGARWSRHAPGRGMPCCFNSPASILFLACFLTGTLASQRSFYAFLLARLQVIGVALDLLDNVFLLDFTLEAAQSILEGLALLKPNFCQTDTPPDSSGRTGYLLQEFDLKSRGC
jgi:hypothetical protein